MSDKIVDFELNVDALLDVAEDKRKRGDLFGAAHFARKAIKKDGKNIFGYLELAEEQALSGDFVQANQTIFCGLHACGLHDVDTIDFRLANNFLRLGMTDVAMYYTDAYDDIDIEDPEEEPEDFFLYYPRTDAFYEHLIEDSYAVAASGNIEKALAMLAVVPDDHPSRETANRAALMFIGAKGDAKYLLENSKKMLEKYPDSVSVRCTLAAAYLARNMFENAQEAVVPLMSKDVSDPETLFLLAHIAVGLKRHGDVVRLLDKLFKVRPNGFPSLLLWFSQGLYNIGYQDEARKVMVKVKDMFGEEFPATYFLKLYAEEPDEVEYDLMLPSAGFVENEVMARILAVLTPNDVRDFEKEHNGDCDNIEYYVRWAVKYGDNSLKSSLISQIAFKYEKETAIRILQNCLVYDDIGYDSKCKLLAGLFAAYEEGEIMSFDVVSQGRFKHIRFHLPKAYYRLPNRFFAAVQMAYSDIILTDEEPSKFVRLLSGLICSIVRVDKNGKLVYSYKELEKIALMRSPDTLAAVLLGKLYEEEETREQIIGRYGVNPRLYDKYYNIIFGDKDE